MDLESKDPPPDYTTADVHVARFYRKLFKGERSKPSFRDRVWSATSREEVASILEEAKSTDVSLASFWTLLSAAKARSAILPGPVKDLLEDE